MKRASYFVMWCLFGALVFFSTSCAQLPQGGEKISPLLGETPTFIQLPATWTPLPSSTFLPTRTQAPAATEIKPTLTLLPSLSPFEASTKISDLLAGNGGCSLPCWWGVQPGISPGSETMNYLQSFVEFIRPSDDSGRPSSFSANFDIPGKSEQGYALLSIRSDIIIGIDVREEATREAFGLRELLAEYGSPEEVYITAQPTPDELWQMTLAVFYPSQGFLATYTDPRAISTNQQIRGCFLAGPDLRLWSLDSFPDREFSEIYPLFDQLDYPFQTLEAATQIPAEDFAETYATDPNGCIVAPENLWPNP